MTVHDVAADLTPDASVGPTLDALFSLGATFSPDAALGADASVLHMILADLLPSSGGAAGAYADHGAMADLAPSSGGTASAYADHGAMADLAPSADVAATARTHHAVSAAFAPSAGGHAIAGEADSAVVVITGTAAMTAALHKIKNVAAALEGGTTIYVNMSQLRPAKPLPFVAHIQLPHVHQLDNKTPHNSVKAPRRP